MASASVATLGYPFNGEIALDEVNTPEKRSRLRHIKAVSGTYCLRQVVVKVVPRALVAAKVLQSNLILSAAIEDETGYNPDSHHWLRTLTIQYTGTDSSICAGVPTDSFFVVLQRCDGNLRSFVRIAKGLRQAAKRAKSGSADQLTATTPYARAAKAWSLPLNCFKPAFLVELCRQQLQAVAFLHEAGRGVFCPTAHGNLKPSNVLLRNGMVKLAEFDCAPLAERLDEHTLRTGAACGQSKPVSPWRPYEAIAAAEDGAQGAEPLPPALPKAAVLPLAGDAVADVDAIPQSSRSAIGNLAPPLTETSERADCFALGCLVFYTLTLGQHPFGRDATEQVQRIRVAMPPQLGALLNKKTPYAIEGADLVQRMLAPPVQLSHGSRVRQCLSHPLFWTVSQKFQLICGVSEGLEVNQHLVPNVHQRAFATDIQNTFTAFLRGDSSWATHFSPPAALGPDGWDNGRLWPFKSPSLYEATYAGPFNMYSLVRFVRNLFVHGASHVRVGVFSSVSDIPVHVLSCFPWLPLALWQVDQRHGMHFTQDALPAQGGRSPSAWTSPSEASAAESGNDSDGQSDTPLVMVSHKRLMPDGSVAPVLPPKGTTQSSQSAPPTPAQGPQAQVASLGAPLHPPASAGAGDTPPHETDTGNSSDSDDGFTMRLLLPSSLQRSGRRRRANGGSRRRARHSSRRSHPRSASQPQGTRRRGRKRTASV